jgi:hypothetical protein
MKYILSMLFLSLFVTACGGGDGGSVSFNDATAVAVQPVSGVAAAGTVISGTVYLRDSATNPTQLSRPIAADGSFSFNVAGMTKPYMLKAAGTANGKSYTIYSLATDIGTVNINPLTNLIVSSASGGADLAAIYSNIQATDILSMATKLPQAVSDVETGLASLLQLYSLSSINPVTDAYVADHTGLDGMFDAVDFNVSNGTVAITNRDTNSVIYSATVAAMTPAGLAAINFPPSPTSTIDTSTGSTSYFPLTIGSKWTYSCTDPNYALTREVMADGRERSIVNSASDNSLTLTYYTYATNRTGVFLKKSDAGTTITYNNQTLLNNTAGTYTQPKLWMPFTTVAGEVVNNNWTFSGTRSLNGVKENDINESGSSKATVIGTETITVPAGSFTAVKIKLEDSSATVVVATSYYWFAKGVGIIKIQNGESGSSYELATSLIK